MFHMRALSLKDILEMKEGVRFGGYVNHHGNYGAYLGCLMTHLVMAAEEHIPSLNTEVSGEGGDAKTPISSSLYCGKSYASQSRRRSSTRAQDVPYLPMFVVGACYLKSLLEMELLQIYNPVDPYALSTYMPCILYGDFSSRVMHDDSPRYY
ncbi:hypothetical protein Cgig2_001017 [Carnegiea gigantea]|uniref:Uncharacterized protein n=1 Tax=Carnegiea gigantea TaxID=171969 RepID=A0A9Q1Q562_9CARY|nr:hypothetical protein Cgig2_001017 [Carnegiea gigantea]